MKRRCRLAAPLYFCRFDKIVKLHRKSSNFTVLLTEALQKGIMSKISGGRSVGMIESVSLKIYDFVRPHQILCKIK